MARGCGPDRMVSFEYLYLGALTLGNACLDPFGPGAFWPHAVVPALNETSREDPAPHGRITTSPVVAMHSESEIPPSLLAYDGNEKTNGVSVPRPSLLFREECVRRGVSPAMVYLVPHRLPLGQV